MHVAVNNLPRGTNQLQACSIVHDVLTEYFTHIQLCVILC